MSFKNFLISGSGRSGTLFLATVLNRSKKWTVLHEAGGYDDFKINTIQEIQQRFNKDHYGEVNGLLRYHIKDLNIAKKSILIRDPVFAWISLANRKRSSIWNRTLAELERSYAEFKSMLKFGDMGFILFDRLMYDLPYLKSVFMYFGVDDVRVTRVLQSKKMGETEIKKYHDISEFNQKIQDRIMKMLDIYRKIERRFK